MAESLIECVANCSEGRNVKTIQALEQAVLTVNDVILLDRHDDIDHNRCVLTFAGSVDSIARAAFELVSTSTKLIDLRHHTGQHPRIGATDVLPFIPLAGATINQCVQVAKKVGRRVGKELGIPVFLYEEACIQPSRKALEIIRRGGLPHLSERMNSDHLWKPNFGPGDPHPSAGAIAIGARYPLIAFNILLNTNNLVIAKEIAKTIRASNGGLAGVKALGLELKTMDKVQVSMNLTNFRETPIHVVYEAVKETAAQYGVSIMESELVGLIPEEAVTKATVCCLKDDILQNDCILESRIRRCQKDGSVLP
jgi:glutamate formiminotransferase/glutamate formiminotransferase/formiminotetrahydrofolate cyclodeaminase